MLPFERAGDAALDRTDRRRRATRLFAAAMVLAGTVVVAADLTHASVAGAVAADKVAICHRDSNVNKPYGPKKVLVNVNGTLDGHTGHTGPVFSPGMTSGWGDIIPPVPAVNFPGLNWNAAGQAIWNNNCQIPEVAPSSSSVVISSSASDSSSSSGGSSSSSEAASSVASTAASSTANPGGLTTSGVAAPVSSGANGPIPVGAEAGLHPTTAASWAGLVGALLMILGALLALLTARRPRHHR